MYLNCKDSFSSTLPTDILLLVRSRTYGTLFHLSGCRFALNTQTRAHVHIECSLYLMEKRELLTELLEVVVGSKQHVTQNIMEPLWQPLRYYEERLKWLSYLYPCYFGLKDSHQVFSQDRMARRLLISRMTCLLLKKHLTFSRLFLVL